MASSLSPDQVAEYERNGYLVIEGFATQDEMRGLRERAESILASFDPESVSVFSTKDQVGGGQVGQATPTPPHTHGMHAHITAC